MGAREAIILFGFMFVTQSPRRAMFKLMSIALGYVISETAQEYYFCRISFISYFYFLWQEFTRKSISRLYFSSWKGSIVNDKEKSKYRSYKNKKFSIDILHSLSLQFENNFFFSIEFYCSLCIQSLALLNWI